jgi:endonuclease/exonuclease/phosphatase family metal-dependent hydrolase
VLVRGLTASPLVEWPLERRRQNGAVLSDHAPVEVTIG